MLLNFPDKNVNIEGDTEGDADVEGDVELNRLLSNGPFDVIK